MSKSSPTSIPKAIGGPDTVVTSSSQSPASTTRCPSVVISTQDSEQKMKYQHHQARTIIRLSVLCNILRSQAVPQPATRHLYKCLNGVDKILQSTHGETRDTGGAIFDQAGLCRRFECLKTTMCSRSLPSKAVVLLERDLDTFHQWLEQHNKHNYAELVGSSSKIPNLSTAKSFTGVVGDGAFTTSTGADSRTMKADSGGNTPFKRQLKMPPGCHSSHSNPEDTTEQNAVTEDTSSPENIAPESYSPTGYIYVGAKLTAQLTTLKEQIRWLKEEMENRRSENIHIQDIATQKQQATEDALISAKMEIAELKTANTFSVSELQYLENRLGSLESRAQAITPSSQMAHSALLEGIERTKSECEVIDKRIKKRSDDLALTDVRRVARAYYECFSRVPTQNLRGGQSGRSDEVVDRQKSQSGSGKSTPRPKSAPAPDGGEMEIEMESNSIGSNWEWMDVPSAKRRRSTASRSSSALSISDGEDVLMAS